MLISKHSSFCQEMALLLLPRDSPSNGMMMFLGDSPGSHLPDHSWDQIIPEAVLSSNLQLTARPLCHPLITEEAMMRHLSSYYKCLFIYFYHSMAHKAFFRSLISCNCHNTVGKIGDLLLVV